MQTKQIPQRTTPSKPMTKEQFMIEYVLRRASGMTEGGFSGDGAAETAARAWTIIQREKNKS